MIANLLPNEATHRSLDLFEKPALLVTVDGSFCQKLGPVNSPDGPMLEFEVTGDRNNFIDLQKLFLEIKCKIVQSSGADLKYDGTATADTARTDAPYFCNNVLHSLFSECSVSQRIEHLTQMEITHTRVLNKLSSHITKMQRTLGWHVKAILTKKIHLQ